MRIINRRVKSAANGICPEIELDNIRHKLSHKLTPFFGEIRQYSSQNDFFRSDLYRNLSEEIHRVENGLDWENNFEREPERDWLRVTAWNIERGINLQGIIHLLKNHPVLRESDVLLLTETDIGMSRSGNKNVPEEISRALKMNYVFANSFIELTKGDVGEQHFEGENTLSLHGCAVLSRFPILSCRTPMLHKVEDEFRAYEKRLGHRRGLICSIRAGKTIFDAATVHLDLRTSPKQRALQLKSILSEMMQSKHLKQIIGGDLNTHTYNMQTKLKLFGSFVYKCLFTGVHGAIKHYNIPGEFFEQPVAKAFANFGFDYSHFNEPLTGTLVYDFHETTIQKKMDKYASVKLQNWLSNRLKPFEGRVPIRLDWLAGKNINPLRAISPFAVDDQPSVLPKFNNLRVSDHLPICVDLPI